MSREPLSTLVRICLAGRTGESILQSEDVRWAFIMELIATEIKTRGKGHEDGGIMAEKYYEKKEREVE